MNEKTLSGAGLTLEQAKVYLCLLEGGLMPVKAIASKTSVGRALIYKILKQLMVLRLVEQRDDIGKITLFLPTHPLRIKEMIANKKSEFEETEKSFGSFYGKLVSDFNMLSGKPSVQFLEGLDGLQKVYDDILDINQDIRVISSPEQDREHALDLIREQIRKQKTMNIRTKAITPLGNQKVATPIEEDAQHLITRKSVPIEKLNIPAQIIIYGDKVAVTNFKETVITVLIESKYISETFVKMFEYIWNH